MRMPSPDGRIGHAEIRIGDPAIMLADEHLEMGHRSPQSLGGAGVSLMELVEMQLVLRAGFSSYETVREGRLIAFAPAGLV
jgi:uncharacterized glyoxalase superfamily protein PhnB